MGWSLTCAAFPQSVLRGGFSETPTTHGYDAAGSRTTPSANPHNGALHGYDHSAKVSRGRVRSLDLAAKGVLEGASSQILLRSLQQLQSKSNPTSDFGVTGNYSKTKAAKFSEVIRRHINDPRVRAIRGTFHEQPVTHTTSICRPG
jgi:hypothetical protein